ncbi:hypothetical protein D5086_030753 [Populus alba]|uniref:Uncharacterized protein n=1 Tax=Populus alba TaxID=43335 RepID=A0ACC4AQC8_POPAL
MSSSSSSSSKSLSLTNLSLFTPLHLSFLFLHLTILVTGDPPPPYVPLDSIALDCGSSDDSIGIDRNWTADINSKVAILDQGSPSTNLKANGASPSSVPYYTARVSLSKFTYTFRVNTTGPKFVRLYFNPASYTGLNRSKASFSVKSGAFNFNYTIQLRYNNHTRYAAPDVLYRTAKTMGPDSTVNKKYNMTWEFPVHSTFNYLVRLHFCQFIPIILQKGDLVFKIYIANQTAERYADIISWAAGYGVPIYKDYVVMMDAGGNEGIQNLSIALHPIPSTQTVNAMLNGAEIFKLSNSDNLAGPNPDAYPDSPISNTPSATSTKPKNSRRTVAIIGAAVAGIAVFSVLFLLIFRRRVQKFKDLVSGDAASNLSPLVSSSRKSTKTHRPSLPSDLCYRFSLVEIIAATNNFDDSFIIGVGGFVRCLLENGIERPSMTDVVWGLEFALQLQESAEEYVKVAQTEKEDNMETPLKGSSIDDSSDLFSTGSELVVNSRILEMATTSSSDGQSFLSNESEKMMSGAVFSEIMNPKGR